MIIGHALARPATRVTCSQRRSRQEAVGTTAAEDSIPKADASQARNMGVPAPATVLPEALGNEEATLSNFPGGYPPPGYTDQVLVTVGDVACTQTG